MSHHKYAIEINGIGKSYKIQHKLQKNAHPTLKDDVMHMLRKPLELVGSTTGISREEFWALKDVSFNVEKGDVVGIMGRNGSGKSTLFKVLSRITQPTEGSATLHGRSASLLEVGTGFHPELSGRENIYFNGSILGMSKKEIDDKFDDIIAFSEVEKFLDTPIKFYSSGMKVRLAFSVAAHLDPEILIIDEVLAVGDVKFKQKSLKRMQQVASSGTTILFVSHIVSQIEKICTRGVLLHDGQLVFDGDLDETIDQYLELNQLDDAAKKEMQENDFGRSDVVSDELTCEIKKLEVTEKGTIPGLDVAIDINNLRGNEFKDLWLGFLIADENGKNVSMINTEMAEMELNIGSDEKTSTVTFTLPQVNLSPGKYSVTLGLRSRKNHSLVYYRADHTAEFTIPDYALEHIKFIGKKGTIPPTAHDFIVKKK